MKGQVFLYAAVVLWLSGCSALNPWNGDYDCRGYPEGVNCKSAREVYELTNYQDSLEKKKGDCPECGAANDPGTPGQPGRYLTPAAAAATTAVQGLGYRGPMPLRSAAQIMRVWVAPWESMDGALHLADYLYAEVVERRWSIGEKRIEVAPQITPLEDRAVPPAPGPSQTKPMSRGQKQSQKQSPVAPPAQNPHPAPSMDLSGLTGSKNAPKNAFFNRKTGNMQGDNVFEQ